MSFDFFSFLSQVDIVPPSAIAEEDGIVPTPDSSVVLSTPAPVVWCMYVFNSIVKGSGNIRGYWYCSYHFSPFCVLLFLDRQRSVTIAYLNNITNLEDCRQLTL